MKSEKSLWSSVSILIGAVIAVLAFVRGDATVWLLLAVFAIWGIWVVGFLLMPMIKKAKKQQKRLYQGNFFDKALDSRRFICYNENVYLDKPMSKLYD